jgi:DNA repair exonuclease SbcCD ATPase subunit
MKDELASLIEKAKGNVKKALEYLLEKGEMSVADVAKEFGLADTASINNPKFRELMGMLKDKGVVSMGGAAPKAAAVKPSKEKIEKAVKAVEKDIETGEEEADDYYKASDEDSAPDETAIHKQATQKANKLTKRTSELDINLKRKIKIETEIQTLLNKYLEAEGDEKSNLAAKLSEKNKEKKEVEALINKFDVV